MDITTVGVIGAGTMGNGIAHVFAKNGYNIILVDSKVTRLLHPFRRIISTMIWRLNFNEALAVPCPTCGAAAGEECELNSGQPRAEPYQINVPFAATRLCKNGLARSSA